LLSGAVAPLNRAALRAAPPQNPLWSRIFAGFRLFPYVFFIFSNSIFGVFLKNERREAPPKN